MKYNFPTEDVVKGMPVTMEAFIALLIFALPIITVGFVIYHFATRKKRREERLAREEWTKKYGSAALKKN